MKKGLLFILILTFALQGWGCKNQQENAETF
jgi:hypothetical protein